MARKEFVTPSKIVWWIAPNRTAHAFVDDDELSLCGIVNRRRGPTMTWRKCKKPRDESKRCLNCDATMEKRYG